MLLSLFRCRSTSRKRIPLSGDNLEGKTNAPENCATEQLENTMKHGETGSTSHHTHCSLPTRSPNPTLARCAFEIDRALIFEPYVAFSRVDHTHEWVFYSFQLKAPCILQAIQPRRSIQATKQKVRQAILPDQPLLLLPPTPPLMPNSPRSNRSWAWKARSFSRCRGWARLWMLRHFWFEIAVRFWLSVSTVSYVRIRSLEMVRIRS